MWSTVFNIHITNTLVCNNIFILVICVWRLFLIIVVWPERQRQSRHFLAWQSSWSTRSTGTQIPLKKNLGSNKKNANFDSTLSGFLKLIGVIFKCLHWASTLLYPRLSVDRRLRLGTGWEPPIRVGVGDASLRMHRLHNVLQFFETSLKNRIVKNWNTSFKTSHR